MFKKKEPGKQVKINNDALTFLTYQYQHINIERLKHLDTLGLGVEGKRILDLGAGIGDHSLFYLYKNCEVTALEGRKDLVDFINERLNLSASCVNFEEELNLLEQYRNYDFAHCFGLLYHLKNPEEFLHSVAKTANVLLLETIVSNESLDDINLIAEDSKNSTQAISGIGCRPNRKWLYIKLKTIFKHVYIPLTQPNHDQFPKDWTNSPKGMSHSRIFFIGSHIELDSPLLTEEFILIHNDEV
ncbi:MAG TPA: methyltransferase domain-containing protein [Pelobium sp.]|nr:methyltransferase domain-containing protein [Pelobium sp.]